MLTLSEWRSMPYAARPSDAEMGSADLPAALRAGFAARQAAWAGMKEQCAGVATLAAELDSLERRFAECSAALDMLEGTEPGAVTTTQVWFYAASYPDALMEFLLPALAAGVTP